MCSWYIYYNLDFIHAIVIIHPSEQTQKGLGLVRFAHIEIPQALSVSVVRGIANASYIIENVVTRTGKKVVRSWVFEFRIDFAYASMNRIVTEVRRVEFGTEFSPFFPPVAVFGSLCVYVYTV